VVLSDVGPQVGEGQGKAASANFSELSVMSSASVPLRNFNMNIPECGTLAGLCEWYAAQCDGNWEHELGVVIDTIDNPGWSVKIDLRGTASEGKEFPKIKTNNGHNDWVLCSVKDAKFIGAGDPSKLGLILDHFLRFVGHRENALGS
jgi:immunity protein 53 of polymorphic toxin system